MTWRAQLGQPVHGHPLPPGREQPQSGHIAGEAVIQRSLDADRCLPRQPVDDPGRERRLGARQLAVAADLRQDRGQAGDARIERVAVVGPLRRIIADHLGHPRPVVVADLAEYPGPGSLAQLAIQPRIAHAATIPTAATAPAPAAP